MVAVLASLYNNQKHKEHGMKEPLTIHNLDAQAIAWIDQQVARSGVSAEVVVRNLILRGLEAEQKQAPPRLHHDLDELAGTWNDQDAAEFNKAVADFDHVDPTIWR